jgi:hypothetical protein
MKKPRHGVSLDTEIPHHKNNLNLSLPFPLQTDADLATTTLYRCAKALSLVLTAKFCIPRRPPQRRVGSILVYPRLFVCLLVRARPRFVLGQWYPLDCSEFPGQLARQSLAYDSAANTNKATPPRR